MTAKRIALLAIGLLFIETIWAKDSLVVSSGAIQSVYDALKTQSGSHRILLQEGVYSITNTINCNTGTAATIRIQPADPSKRPILVSVGREIFSISKDSTTIEGLELITDNTAIRIAGSGTTPGARGVTISRCHIHGPSSRTINIGIRVSKDNAGQSDGVNIVNNLITDAATNGIQVFTTPSLTGLNELKIIQNTILMDKNTGANSAIGITGPLAANASFKNNALYFSAAAHIQITSGGATYTLGRTLYDQSRTSTPFLPASGAGSFTLPGGAILTPNPKFASYTSECNSVGRPLIGSPLIDAGEQTNIAVDLYGRARGSNPDVGAIEYLANYSDTIYVAPTGNDSAKGDRGRPVKTVKHAFEKKIPDSLRYPAVIRLSAGSFPAFSLTGKKIYADTGLVWVVNEDDQFTNRPVVTGTSQAIEIQGNSIHVEGLTIRVASGIGILVKGGSHEVGIHRCFIRPETGGSMLKAIDLNSSAGTIGDVTIENCLIDYKEATANSGAITINAQTNTINTVNVLYNSIYLENRSGETALRISSLTGTSISDLKIAYNIFDSPKRAAIVSDVSVTNSLVLKNFNYNSPRDTVVVDGNSAGFYMDENRHVSPVIVSYDVNSPTFLQIDSAFSPCRADAGYSGDLISPLKDYGNNLRTAYGTFFSTGAYVPLGKAVVDTPKNLIQLTVTADRRDRFSLQFDGLGNYTTGKIDTLGLWWFQGVLPPASSVDVAHPSWSVPFTKAMQDGGRHIDSLISSAFVPGTMYYFLASVKGRKEFGGIWAPIMTAQADSEVCYVDRTPPPNLISLRADSISGQPNQIQLCWRADSALLLTDADSVGIWYKYSGPPDSATDPNAVRVGIFKLQDSACTVASGLTQGKRHYFVAFVRDSVKNWSTQGANSQAMAQTPNAADTLPPANNLKIHLTPETTGTSVIVSWDNTLVPEPKCTVGVTYDTAGFLPIPANRPSPWTHVSAAAGQLKITGLERGVVYYFALSLADSQYNWAASTDVSSDSVQTYVGTRRTAVLFNGQPDTVSLVFAIGNVEVGWATAGPVGGSSYDISYFAVTGDSLVVPSSAHLRALSHTLHFNKALTVGGFIGSGAYLSIPVLADSLQAAALAAGTTPEVVLSRARLYRFTPPGTWSVIYTSQAVGNSMTAGSITQAGSYRVMWDSAPPVIIGYNPITDQRRINGLQAYTGINDTLQISDLAVSNCRGYVRYGYAGRTDAQGSRCDTVYQSADGKIPVIVPSNYVTERGYHASLVVTDGINSTSLDFSFPTNFPSLSTSPLKGNNQWNFISFPAELGDRNPAKVFGRLGQSDYDPLKWRLFKYDNASSQYIEAFAQNGTTPLFNLEPGKGYWVVLRSDESGLDAGAGKTVPAGTNFKIPIGAGWNDFGIPFNFRTEGDSGICLGDIIDSSRFVSGRFWIYGLDSAQNWVRLFNPMTGPHFTGTPLLPWRGYTVWSAGPDTLRIPPISRLSSKYRNASSKSAHETSKYWGVKVSAQWKTGEETAYMGTNPGTRFYAPRPGRPFEEVSLSIRHQYAAGKRIAATSVCGDTLGSGQTWTLCLKNSSGQAQVVAISLGREGSAPLGMQTAFWNPSQASAFSMFDQAGSQFTIKLENGDSLEFKVLAGSSNYMAQSAAAMDLPQTFALYSCGPNPFNPITTIGFDIPFSIRAAQVAVEIRDSRGRLVTTLYSGSMAGRHRKTWDAKGIATGVYYVRMLAKEGDSRIFQSVKKLVLLK